MLKNMRYSMFGATTGFRQDQSKHNDAVRSEVSFHSSSTSVLSQQDKGRDYSLQES